MSKTFALPKLTKIWQIATIAIVAIFSTIFLVGLSINVSAQKIGVKPYNEPGQDRGVFRFIVNPGDEVDDTVLLVNGSTFDGNAVILAKDAILDSSGNIAFRKNDEPNSAAGNWIKLSLETATVPAGKGLKVPFRLSIPANTPSGEYAAGIVGSPKDDSNQNSGVAVSTRSATTVYITVKGDLKLDNKISDFSIINPTQQDFATEVDKRSFIKPTNMVAKFKGENLGNVFSRIDSKLTFELPDGNKKEIPFKRTLNLGQNSNNLFYVNSDFPYAIGTTKVTLEYKSEAYNITNGEVAIQKTPTSDGVLEYSFTLTQADLERFNNVQKEIQDRLKQDFGTTNKPQDEFVVKQEESKSAESVKTEEKKQDNTLIYVLIALIVVLLGAFVGYVVYSQRKNKNEEKPTTTDAAAATTVESGKKTSKGKAKK